MKAKPVEVRQARAFLYNRGVVVSGAYCRLFAQTAKVMRVSFGRLHEQIDSGVREQRDAT